MDQNMILNTIYHSAVLSGLSVGYNYFLKRFIKFDVGDLAKSPMMKTVKLAGIVTLAQFTKSYLEKMKIIPPNIKHI